MIYDICTHQQRNVRNFKRFTSSTASGPPSPRGRLSKTPLLDRGRLTGRGRLKYTERKNRVKKLAALLKSRRGVAIEFAIGVMFITVAVSTILFSVAINEINARNRDNDSFTQKLAVEQYAEEVLVNKADKMFEYAGNMRMHHEGILTDKPSYDFSNDVQSDYFSYSCEVDSNDPEIVIIKIMSKAEASTNESQTPLLIIHYHPTSVNDGTIKSWTWQ